MDPRLREDDGSNVMPAPCASFLLFRVIPAEAGIHPRPRSAPGTTRMMDPRLREVDGNCGGGCKRALGAKPDEKGANWPKNCCFHQEY